jgi:DNA primase
MGGLIPQSFIDEILSRVDIVDVIHERVPLRKAGRNYQALCPFHSEKTPSFTVNRDKQFYYCFGCGAHGSAIGFLMEAARLSFIEAVQELANRVGLQLPSTDRSGLNNPPQTQLYEALQSAAHFYAVQLRKHPSAPGAVNYLKQRGLSGIIAAKFGLGYAPPGRDNLLKALGETSAKVQLLLRAGLVIPQKSKGGYYDRFRDRIIFPIQDQRGRVVGFGGRVLGEEDRPKYLNSPETEVFHKGQMLYGVYHARKECKQLTRLLIVEGYMDVISLAQHGVGNAVATLGTALTLEHLEHAFRVAPEVIFCFDGDEAGQRAAWRALEIALPELKAGRYVGFLFLPPGEDPDTLVRKQGSGFFQDPSRIMPLSDFLFNTLCQQIDRASLEGKARLIDRAKPLISKLPPSPLQQLMVKRLAELSDLQADQLIRMIGTKRSLSPGDTETVGSASQQSSRLVKTAIKLLLHEPSLAVMADDPPLLASLECPRVALLVSMLELAQKRPEISAGAMLERWRGTEEEDYFSQLVGEEFLVPEEGIKEEFSGAIARLRELSLKRKREALLKLKTRPDHLTPAEKEELRRTPVPAKGSKEPL